MTFTKTSLFAFPMPYALGSITLDGRTCVVAATEDRGPVVVSRPPYSSAQILVPGPGGCMSLVGSEHFPNQVFAIMGCFLGYQFQTGAVYRIDAAQGEAEKLVDLPFAHRLEVVAGNGTRSLVVSNLAADKTSPADWAQPGATYRLELDETGRAASGLVPLLEGIHKNHGFLKTNLLGHDSVLISGSEGLFSLRPDSPGRRVETLLPQEVSEVAVFDLDGDGEPELATIEPFHGHRLVVYKRRSSGWTAVWETALDYGHCVLAEVVGGRPSLLVSNRAGSRDLLLFQFPEARAGTFPEPHRIVVDSGVGAANMLVLKTGDEELIFATNQVQGELVSYRSLC